MSRIIRVNRRFIMLFIILFFVLLTVWFFINISNTEYFGFFKIKLI